MKSLNLLPAVVGLLLLLVSNPVLKAADAAPAKPAVLFSGWTGGMASYEFVRRLHQEGFAVREEPGADPMTPLTWEKARHYNVIVMSGIGSSNADNSLNAANKETIATLNRFMQAGGGVLYLPEFYEMGTQLPPQEAFGQPLGLKPLFDELVFDPAHVVVATVKQLNLVPTTEITPSPITQGVTSLWFPTGGRTGAQNQVTTSQFDPSWHVVVTGSKTSFSRTVSIEIISSSGKDGDPGVFKSSVPLVGYKEVGKGRMVVCGISSGWLYGSAAANALEGIVADHGLNGVPSQGYQLFSNSLHWLAEPSLADATAALGGAEQDPALLENPQMMKFSEPLDWTKINLQSFPAISDARPGVIGARTALSGGKGTVEDWVKEAKAEGLSYIVFLEDFAQLSPENFKTLKSECARLTDAGFAAIPGIRIQDVVGNHYFYCGVNVLYPPKKLLSDDGKAFTSYDPDINPKDPRGVKGQINMAVLIYTYTLGGFRFTAGNYLYHDGTSPFPNFFGVFTSVGVITRQNGKMIEDATPDFLDMAHAGQGPLPMVVDLMDDPAELKQTPWRTVLRLSPPAAGVVNPVITYFETWHFYPDTPTAIYITSGPQIDYWSYTGSPDYVGSNRGDFIWQGYRWHVGGKVSSPEGLKEVSLYDGAKLFRRFLPQGRKEFDFALDLNHNQQHDLVLIATDVKGGQAISGEQWDRNHRMEEFNCGDRDNQLSYGLLTRRDGTSLLIGEAPVTPNKRTPESGCSPEANFTGDPLLGAPAFDGGVGGFPGFELPVTMRIPGGEIPAPRVGECQRLLETGDTHMSIAQCFYNFADNVPVYNCWHSLWRPEVAKDFTVERRNQDFQVDPDSPLAVFRMRLRIKLVRDLPNTGFVLSTLGKGLSTRWSILGSDGQTFVGSSTDAKAASKTVNVPFSLNAYAAALDSGMGSVAIFPLSDGTEMTWDASSPMDMSVILPAANSPQKKDETREADFLVLGIPRLTAYTQMVSKDSLATVQRFVADFGLNGKPPAYTTDLQGGTITGQRYILNVDGHVDNAFSGTLKGELISTLPIAVSNLNGNWSAFLYDRAEKKARPLGVLENQAWATVRLHGQDDLFIGDPVTCDNPNIILQLTQTGDNAWRLEAHNPTDADVTVNLSANRFFDPLKDKTISDKPVVIPAGQSVFFDL